jgi:hypothetical protein
MKVEFADSSGEFNQDVDVAYGRLLAASSSLRVARTLSCEWMGDHLPGGRLRLWMAGENGSFQIFEFFSFN